MSKKTSVVLFGLLTISILSFTSRAVGFGIGVSAYLKDKSVAIDSVTWWVPDNFATIQEAVNSPLVSIGDTIRVRESIYYEHVVINKTVSLIGENRSTTIIDGGGTRTVVNVTANDVHFSGFTVRNGDYGIYVFNSTNSVVSGNNVNNNEWEGIWVDHSSFCVISENNASNNRWDGIWLKYSNHSTVSRNTVFNNYAYGIIVDYLSNNCTISENDAIQNWIGISVEKESHNCTVTKNNANNNQYHGLQIYLSQNCTITRNNANSNYYYGIHVYFSNGSAISKNVADNNGEGIYLEQSDLCTIDENAVHNNYYGLWLVYSDHCTAVGNTARNNTIGVYLYLSNDTVVYHNNIVNNTNQAEIIESYDSAWDNGYPSGGNYWSDYPGVDHFSGPGQNESGSDGIGDIPYVIDVNNTDNYPLMNPWTNIAITNVLPHKTVVGQGYSSPINVIVENQGDFTETFNVTAYYDDIAIILPNGKNYTTITLTSRNYTTVTFTWNTTGLAKGNYTIKAEATPVLGETDTGDNTYTNGWVVVTTPGDFDVDDDVDIDDIRYFCAAYIDFWSVPSIKDPLCDFDDDCDIDIDDIRTFAEAYITYWTP